MYAIVISTARSRGRKPALKLAWVTKVLPDGSVRAHVASLARIANPNWSKSVRSLRANQVAQFFGPNVKPTPAEIRAIRAKQKPYQPEAGDFDAMGYGSGL